MSSALFQFIIHSVSISLDLVYCDTIQDLKTILSVSPKENF